MTERKDSISPPPLKRRRINNSAIAEEAIDLTQDDAPEARVPTVDIPQPKDDENIRLLPSPIRLNFIPEFPASSNNDCVSLSSILSNPLITEAWLFNYLIDIDFVLSQFDPDVRSLVSLKVVHGSWRRDDANGLAIAEAAKRHPNVQNIVAYMPEAFGTHHSKMIILFRADDVAQVIITTGNFIEQDWSMSQAFWVSPLLPLLKAEDASTTVQAARLGTGVRFKHDLLAYIKAYGNRLGALPTSLSRYDFSTVRAALVASVPSKIKTTPADQEQILWGIPSLKRILSGISAANGSTPKIVTQISSVASVGEKWLNETFFPTLETAAMTGNSVNKKKADHSIVFPTPKEIRNSIDGYGSGASIHMKNSTATHAAQLSFLRPLLCHWAPASSSSSSERGRDPQRHPAAPHIKTYIRFRDETCEEIEWAMMTSANLSTQAWGTENRDGEWRVQSYEIGVVIWPDLFLDHDPEAGTSKTSDSEKGEGEMKAKMVPVFEKDVPDQQNLSILSSREDNEVAGDNFVIGMRMPYALPLHKYADGEEPWINSKGYTEKDWMGRKWNGRQS